jgi:hypothetical protein
MAKAVALSKIEASIKLAEKRFFIVLAFPDILNIFENEALPQSSNIAKRREK